MNLGGQSTGGCFGSRLTDFLCAQINLEGGMGEIFLSVLLTYYLFLPALPAFQRISRAGGGQKTGISLCSIHFVYPYPQRY